MSRSFSRGLLCSLIACVSILFVLSAPPTWGQGATVGAVTITVLDTSGAYVPGASLALKNVDTNHVRSGATGSSGLYRFVNLPFGTFELTVSKAGFATQVMSSVVVQAGRVTDVKVILQVGEATQKVVVTTSAVPLLQTTSNAISTTIDMKQINDLPLFGRNVSQLVFLTPGYSGMAGYGTWNGLPLIAQSNTVDGVAANTTRMKFGGNATPAMSARLEDIGEMTVATSQTDVNQGFGEASMGASYLTRRGTNAYHGEVYEDFRNAAMNANSWYNNAVGQPRNALIRNEFGGAIGGPIRRNKLFFFGSFSTTRQPGGNSASQTFLSPNAQNGIYTVWQPQPKGSPFTVGQTINLYTAVAAPNGLPASINNPGPCTSTTTNTYGNISCEMALINKDLSATNANISPSGDPNTETVNWFVPAPEIDYYPAIRLDYNATQKFRANFEFEETRQNFTNASAPYYPGSDFANQTASQAHKDYTSSLGLSWTISPSLVNQFRVGYLYFWDNYGFGAQPRWSTQPAVNWALGNSGQEFNLATSDYYPTISGGDTLEWLKGAHTFMFGFDYNREQDHYYNAPDGIPSISLGLVNGDPAYTAFQNYFTSNSNSNDRTEAENLYATLVGRISGVGPIGSGFPYDPATGGYTNKPGLTVNLDELQRQWGLFFSDTYRFKPTLTFNYGLRWDFIGDDYDLAHQYLGTPLADFYGPSGVNNLFNPGVTIGTNNPAYVAQAHQYGSWNVTPQPTIGIAWNPDYSDGLLGKIMGGSKTVIRAGFDLKRFTEPNQYFWNFGTNHGIGYFQYFSLTATPGGAPGTFAPGSLTLGQPFGTGTSLPYSLAPPFYSKVVPQSELAFNYYWGEAGFDPNIKQPYVQQWNLGIQRQLGHSDVLEVRYLGQRSVHQWLAVNPNEVNIFENGFLSQFQNAQANLAINAQNGITSFADNGYTGQQPLPIFDTAFAGEASGGTGVPLADYGNANFITDLHQGAAGDLAYQLSVPNTGPVSYLCNMVGSSFTPCATGAYGASYAVPGKYPVNFFQANPYGASCLYCSTQQFMSNGGYSMYNGLQVDFRQKQWHGAQFDVNYTWSHTLGVQPDGQWLGTFNEFTMRNLRLSYGPTLFDLRHVIHASGTYDLPFGSGKAFLNRSGIVDRIVGGWTLGSIFTYETGFPFTLTGGYSTFNNYGDGGLVFNGVTLSQLQHSVGVYHPSASQYPNLPLGPWAYDINPKFLVATQGPGFTQPATCNSGLVGVCQNTTPGTFTSDPYLYGPHLWNDDMSLTKVVPITERLRFVLQCEALNVFNHPEFASPGNHYYGGTGASAFNGGASIQGGASFGQAPSFPLPYGAGGLGGPRLLEIRARLDF